MRIFKHPIKKLTLGTAFGAGYVLGAKAGRERYEQIRRTAEQVKNDPRVQQAATKVAEDPRVKDVVSKAEDLAKGAGAKVGVGAGDDSSDGQDAGIDVPVSEPTVDTAVAADLNPLLADEHVGAEDDVVYTTGPDVEESVEELRAAGRRGRP